MGYRFTRVNLVNVVEEKNPVTRAPCVGHTCSETSVDGVSMEGTKYETYSDPDQPHHETS